MLDIDPKILARLALRLKHLEEWFREYAIDPLAGEELSAAAMDLPGSAWPTICLVEEIRDLEVIEADDLGAGVVRAPWRVNIVLELDLGDEDLDTASREASMWITLEVNTRDREVAGYHLGDVEAAGY